jgi:adenylate kinase
MFVLTPEPTDYDENRPVVNDTHKTDDFPAILLPEFPKDIPKEINEQILIELKSLHVTLNELLKNITNL